MKSLSLHRPWHSLMAAFLVPLLAFLLACGPGEEPTPIPTATLAPTATPTQAPAATPTSALPGPVASPTPTSVATPTPVPTPSEQPKRGGRLQFLVGNLPPDFDGHVTSSGAGMGKLPGMWGTNLLINYQGTEVECEACTEWHLEDGGKTMVFNIMQGIKFHDGRDLTSADVAYSLKKIMGEIDGIPSPRQGVIKEYIRSVETPSRYQLKVAMVRPSLFVPKVLAYTYSTIYPEGTTRAMLKEKPYGSGPFLITEYLTGASMKFDRNPNYFKKGLPYIDGVDFVIVGDASTRVAAFLTGRELIYSFIGKPPVYSKQLDSMVAEGKINHEKNLAGCGPHWTAWVNFKPPFTDLRVRQAINLAIDRKAYAEIAYQQYAVPQLMMYGPGEEYGTPEDKIWDVVPGWGTGAKKQQEIEQAKKLLADAGFPNGMDVELMARLPFANFGYSATTEPTQQWLGKVGIRAKLAPVDSVTHELRMAKLDFQMNHFLFCVPSQDVDDVIGTYWITGASRGWFGYSNPEVDRLFPLMSGELDPQKRKELFFRIQDIIVLETVGYAPTPKTHDFNYWWKSLKGVTLGMDGWRAQSSSGIARMDRVWIDN